MYYMDKRFLITLLTSSNERLLKLSYETVINQKNHNLDYEVIIVVNSLNSDYYSDVCKEFSDYDVEIVETESNGKPGKGHNSLFNVFFERIDYDYMISLDGDDFLYPYALSQLEKCLKMKEKLDIICLYGNDTIRGFNDSEGNNDIYLTNNFYLRMGYNIPKIFHESKSLKNPFNCNIETNGVITVLRFILCSRDFIIKNKDIDLYCNECNILDDYRFYLNFIDNILNKNMKGVIINSDHIYLYNNINDSSISIKNKDKFKEDYKIIKNYYNDFNHLTKKIGLDWNLNCIDYLNLDEPFEKIKMTKNSDNTYNLCKDSLVKNKNYIYCVEFASNISIKYYNICIKIIEESLFKKTNISQAFNLLKYLNNNNNSDRRLYIYLAICYYYFNKYDKVIEYMDKSDYMKYKYKELLKLYKKI